MTEKVTKLTQSQILALGQERAFFFQNFKSISGIMNNYE